MITSAYRREGGGQEGPKCDYVIFEWSLIIELVELQSAGFAGK